MTAYLEQLKNTLEGELFFDELHKTIYATDASVYRKIPLAVAYPKNSNDLKLLLSFASKYNTSIIPRTAGTSLAGQCVGDGIIVDVSKYFTAILNVDINKKQITVQPGLVRDDLNNYLKPYGLFFGPNTSTSNRCMIGGMVGNNSSGTTSIKYGVTRDKIVSLEVLLADGTPVVFSELSKSAFIAKTNQTDAEGEIYRCLHEILSSSENQKQIRQEFPKRAIHRRNTGYALDELLYSAVYDDNEAPINLCKLLAGSEGTLAITTAITLQLDELPPVFSKMVVPHYNALAACLNDVELAMQHDLYTCEMMDKIILDCTKNNKTQLENRFFVKEDPEALLMLELKAASAKALEIKTNALLKALELSGNSYHNALLNNDQIPQALALRKAGLGLLGNMVGDKKAVACIEDTAVALGDLAPFIAEFTHIMDGYNQKPVYYAHAGAGELHLRPILDLKKKEDLSLFRKITTDVAKLTKKYRGSFSGEHGDGIVRAEFIPFMIGSHNYHLLEQIKQVFDPNNILNPGKIVAPFPMDESLRYIAGREEPNIKTFLDFDDSQGVLRVAEQCNGSGDCRKPAEADGGMCPSYHATKNERDTTRARANALREVLTNNGATNKFDNESLKAVFDLCLSCKACASECPSNVDIAILKTEFLYQYQEANGYDRRSKLFAKSTRYNRLASKLPVMANVFFNAPLTSQMIKRISGIAAARRIPNVSKQTFTKWYKKQSDIVFETSIKKIYLFVDEFTNYLESEIGIAAYTLLTRLGYDVHIIDHLESGRSYLSKGFLKEAKTLADKNIRALSSLISVQTPLVGIEPSAILSFRDEYPRLATNKTAANAIANCAFLFEEFFANELKMGNISASQFHKEHKTIKIHNHCHQKALSNQKVTFDILNLPVNYVVTVINSGCCGMAGSFGYEKEHFEISMTIGEQKLFPAIRKTSQDVVLAANGSSCRHQIKDGTKREAIHPAMILLNALNP